MNSGGCIPRREATRHFSLRLQNGEYPRIFRVTGANQNARKLLSTDLANTNRIYKTPLVRQLKIERSLTHSSLKAYVVEDKA